LTVIVAVADPELNPAPPELVAPCTWKLKVDEALLRFAAGVNFKPALPSANVIRSPLLIAVEPLFLNSAPLVMLVILKCVTSPPSAALRLITRPDALCTSSFVVALVTDGVSATGLTVKTKVSVILSPLLPFTVTVMVEVPN
jgi:hypothetical protein